VLAVTFTVRAAQELKTRLDATAGDEAWRVDADTVHGFALDWLMRFGQSVGVYPDTFVYSEDADRLALLANYVSSLGETADKRLRAVLAAIDSERTAGGLRCDGPDPDGPAVGGIPFADLYDGYLAALDAAGGIDFAGILVKFVEAADSNPRFIANFHGTFRHVLVDEGQDLSVAQVEVISRLVGPAVDLFVVADDRQSINGFAGGSFENAKRLFDAAADAPALVLPHNFRCATTVLSAAEKLATHLRARPSKALAVDHAPPGTARSLAAGSPIEEAESVGEWITHLLKDGLDSATLSQGEDPRISPEDVAVVVRARWLLDPVHARLEALGIAVSLQTDTQSFLHTPVARAVAEAIALTATPGNGPASRRLGDELRGLGATGDVELAGPGERLRGAAIAELTQVASAVEGLTIDNLGERLRNLVTTANEKDLERDLRRLENLWVSYTVAVPQNRRELAGFLRHMFRAQQTRPSDPGVRLLTIHKVKGLEFRAVCLLGAYNGVLPDYRASSAEQVDDERRAFYVAITRAARSLLITYPRETRDQYGRRHSQDPSLFTVESGLA